MVRELSAAEAPRSARWGVARPRYRRARVEAARIEQKARLESGGNDVDLLVAIDTLRHSASKLRRAVYDLRSEKGISFLEAVESLVETNLSRPPSAR